MDERAGRFVRGRSIVRMALAACISLLLVACGDSVPAPSSTATTGGNNTGAATPTGASTTTGGGPITVNVDMIGFKFSPAEVTVPVGSTVVWTNKESFKHTVTEDSGVFDSGTLEKGGTFSRKFDTPGTVSYFCKFHGSAGQGMFGKVIVTPASGGTSEASPTAATTAAPEATSTTAAAPTATTATVANATATTTTTAPVGTVNFSDNVGLTDQLVLSATTLPRPAGKAFYAWLTNSASGAQTALGRLTPDANGGISLTYEDPANANLLSSYDGFLITNEELETSPTAPSTDVAASGQLPSKALVHIKHLLVSFDVTPNKIGLEVGLRSQTDLVHQHADLMSQAQAAGNLAGIKLHSEHLVNIIEGAKGPNFGDLNKDGKVTNPGDGFGLLQNGDQLGYLQGSKDHAELAANAADATAGIKLHAGHVGVTVDNVTGWVTAIRDKALEVAKAADTQAASSLVRDISALANQALNGVDLKGDGQVLPIPGSGGAITSYQHAQLMAAIPLQPGGSAPAGTGQATPAATAATSPATPAAQPTATGAQPAPTTTGALASPTSAAASEVKIDIKGFTFGEPVTVKVGTKVTWTNLHTAPHTITADDNSFDSGVLQPNGPSFSFTFTKAGEFPYYCAIHGGPGGQGMSSKIIVQP